MRDVMSSSHGVMRTRTRAWPSDSKSIARLRLLKFYSAKRVALAGVACFESFRAASTRYFTTPWLPPSVFGLPVPCVSMWLSRCRKENVCSTTSGYKVSHTSYGWMEWLETNILRDADYA